MKKKFVTETQYCITLDRIPESFYPEIAANERQREEWVKLFSIDDIKGDRTTPSYSDPLTIEFLKTNLFLLIDTRLFNGGFKARLLNEIPDLDQKLDGLLIHSENSQGLRFVKEKLSKKIQCTYIDPPYNTGSDGFPYKDSFKASSWTTMMNERLNEFAPLLTINGVIFCSINEIQRAHLDWCMQSVLGSENRVEELIWARDTVSNNSPAYSTNHEYIEVFAFSKSRVEAEKSMFREERAGYAEVRQLIDEMALEYPSVDEIKLAIKLLYDNHRDEHIRSALDSGISKEEAKKSDPWKGLYPYKHAEYRDKNGQLVNELKAKDSESVIWVYREVEPSMPSGKQAADIRDDSSENYRFYTPIHPSTNKPCKPPKRGWAFPRKAIGNRPSFDSYNSDNRIVFKSDESTIPQLKYFLHEVASVVSTSVIRQYSDGEPKLEAMFGEKGLIDNPKPPALIEKLVRQTTKKDSLILDFFSGSGTTASAVVNSNRKDDGCRKYILIEVGSYFETVLKPRVIKSAYCSEWKDGCPELQDGLSHAFKYIRLESYEDVLNNLLIKQDENRTLTLSSNPALQRDYLINYFLDVETDGSQSLLNIDDFRDPTAYKMRIKKPGSDEQILQTIDLIETFNWLLGLWVDHLAAPQSFSAEFDRESDPDLPGDQNTRLICKRLRVETNGEYWFRLVEGYTLRVPGDDSTKIPTLIIWRKLTDDAEKDNAALQKYLETIGVSTREKTYEVIYVNGSHTLPNPVVEGEQTKVRLTEEAFHQAMWAEA